MNVVAQNLQVAAGSELRTVSLGIEGMTCASCERRVEKGLEGGPGVARVAVTLGTEKAEVALDPTLVSGDMLVEAIEEV
ncbi:MAG TPA: heavy metal-associated domain-containing protein, partial [Saliniramus sp.]|nr:heavy metal-associated domain-containing protein [Saliniramus sp.]